MSVNITIFCFLRELVRSDVVKLIMNLDIDPIAAIRFDASIRPVFTAFNKILTHSSVLFGVGDVFMAKLKCSLHDYKDH